MLLTDAETGTDPVDPSKRACQHLRQHRLRQRLGLFNADRRQQRRQHRDRLAASLGYVGSETFWGCRTGAVIGGQSASRRCDGVSGSGQCRDRLRALGRRRSSRPRRPRPPTPPRPLAFAEPADGAIVAGEAFVPNVAAKDDFGVSAVTYAIDGVAQAPLSRAPYEFAGWTPEFDELGETHELSTTVTDSAGQTTTSTVEATVVAPAGYLPATLDGAARPSATSRSASRRREPSRSPTAARTR